MIDKNLEARIKQLTEFVDLWKSFYGLYKRAGDQQNFTEDEEKIFLNLKAV